MQGNHDTYPLGKRDDVKSLNDTKPATVEGNKSLTPRFKHIAHE